MKNLYFKLPDNLRKFLRDGIVATAGGLLLYVGDNIGILNLSPEINTIATAFALLLYRALRSKLESPAT